MPIAWTPDLAVGVETIDNQHKELFQRVSALLDACSAGKGKETIREILAFLEGYVVEHFNDEESLMVRHGYPGYSEHKSLHEQFIREFTALKQQIESDGATGHIVIQTNRIVVNWLNQHIRNVDKLVGAFLKEKKG